MFFYKKPKMSRTAKIIWVLIVLGLGFMMFPGILFFHDRAEPFILGMPFIYGYTLLWWLYFCILTFVAFLLNWGEKRKNNNERRKAADGSLETVLAQREWQK